MESPPPTTTLPRPSRISGRTLSFLNRRFNTQQDLSIAPSLVSNFKSDCSDLNRTLDELVGKLSLAASDWTSRSDGVRSTMLGSLDSCCPPSPASDGNGVMSRCQKRILGVELPLLAKEVARIDTVRLYTALVDCFSLFLAPEFDSTPCVTVINQLLQFVSSK